MKEDAFSKYHPAVNLLFFVGVICFSVLLQHPVYLLVGLFNAAIYYLLLNGRKGLKIIMGMIPLFLFITLLNPMVNTRGRTILFFLFGRPYTLEALIYGAAVAAIFVAMMLWMGCCHKVLTGDKFTCLFSNIIPSIALLLVMVFRMIPNLPGKAKQIIDGRSAIGKGAEESDALKDKLLSGVTVLGVLTSIALEGSIVTGYSMRARGYGTTKRSSFIIYSMTCADRILLSSMVILIGIVIGFAVMGCMNTEFLPEWKMAPVSGINLIGFMAYLGFLMIPTLLQIKEALQWNISRYKI